MYRILTSVLVGGLVTGALMTGLDLTGPLIGKMILSGVIGGTTTGLVFLLTSKL
jgi:hypothetical protein